MYLVKGQTTAQRNGTRYRKRAISGIASLCSRSGVCAEDLEARLEGVFRRVSLEVISKKSCRTKSRGQRANMEEDAEGFAATLKAEFDASLPGSFSGEYVLHVLATRWPTISPKLLHLYSC